MKFINNRFTYLKCHKLTKMFFTHQYWHATTARVFVSLVLLKRWKTWVKNIFVNSWHFKYVNLVFMNFMANGKSYWEIKVWGNPKFIGAKKHFYNLVNFYTCKLVLVWFHGKLQAWKVPKINYSHTWVVGGAVLGSWCSWCWSWTWNKSGCGLPWSYGHTGSKGGAVLWVADA